MKKVIILFGEMGSGKNYWGDLLSKQTGYEFFDGDGVIPHKMAAKIAKFQSLTRDMIEDYMDVLSNTLVDKMDHCQNLIVAQALYCDADRKALALFLSSLGYQVEFFWIRPSFWQNAKQLLTRPNGWQWVRYWLFNKPWFQKPTHQYLKVSHELMQNLL